MVIQKASHPASIQHLAYQLVWIPFHSTVSCQTQLWLDLLQCCWTDEQYDLHHHHMRGLTDYNSWFIPAWLLWIKLNMRDGVKFSWGDGLDLQGEWYWNDIPSVNSPESLKSKHILLSALQPLHCMCFQVQDGKELRQGDWQAGSRWSLHLFPYS